jgi:TBC1 domain family protein 5
MDCHVDFQDKVQSHMLRVLTVWACLHPELSYRQGMHELLAPIIKVLDHDVTTQQECSEQDDSDEALCLAQLLNPRSALLHSYTRSTCS